MRAAERESIVDFSGSAGKKTKPAKRDARLPFCPGLFNRPVLTML